MPSRVLIRRSPIVYLALFALVAVLLVATARFAFGGTFDGGSDQSRIVAAVKADKPSVVALQVTVNGTQYVPVDPFGDTQAQNVQGRASGSGFVYSKSGLIVTNAHVVSPPTGGRLSNLQVLFANGDRVPGHVVGIDAGNDVALVKVDDYAKLPPPLPLGNSNAVEAGEWAIAIGEPLELKQTVTVGVVSAFNRSEPIGSEDGGQPHVFKGLLQTSAPINPGNSGGPLIDMAGRVIGINQSVAGDAQGIGFAIPIDSVRTDVAALLANPSGGDRTAQAAAPNDQSTAPHGPSLGINLSALSGDIRSQLNYNGEGGVAIVGVRDGSAADGAGIVPGDVIVGIDGNSVTSPEQVAAVVRNTPSGGKVDLQLWSAGNQKDVAVAPSE